MSFTESQAGRAHTFVIAVASIVIWAATGTVFGFSDTWQLVINTGTTIVTFLMVFLIQHSQNWDTQAMQLKLDELIRVNRSTEQPARSRGNVGRGAEGSEGRILQDSAKARHA